MSWFENYIFLIISNELNTPDTNYITSAVYKHVDQIHETRNYIVSLLMKDEFSQKETRKIWSLSVH